jgi:hypothetical protein
MGEMTDMIWAPALIGIGGTAAMDLWALLLNRVFGVPLPNWAMVGRWFAHVPRGALFHQDIGKAAPVAGELTIGWAAHYAVGIVYGYALALAAGPEWLAAPRFLPALVTGLVTVSAGWFLLQPGMGAGWAASKRDNPWTIRALNLVAHSWFGVGLWLGALVIA